MRKIVLFLTALLALALWPAAQALAQVPTPKCQTGRTYNASWKRCVYSMQSFCPQGFQLQGERCVVQVTCPAGSVNDGAGCKVPCPTGYSIKIYEGISVCAGAPPCPSTARVVSYEENRRIGRAEPNAIVASGECRMECPRTWPVQWTAANGAACLGPGECPAQSSYDKTMGRCVWNMTVGCSGQRQGDSCFEMPSCGKGYKFNTTRGNCVPG